MSILAHHSKYAKCVCWVSIFKTLVIVLPIEEAQRNKVGVYTSGDDRMRDLV
jgi:hypothetical protein